ncbi:hypothetical protein DSO57_1029922 [Entomophthora muscae]|uniref:Uncharacterized protein n=1 Tax=Entomophthora muscae TaxID=34485 RepID=A0ACC2RS00_9FUNG|nr:hypothetical protein DSO57_1029922 [Entomophthora muscae]
MINDLDELVLTSLAACRAPALERYRVGHVRLSFDRLNSYLSFYINSSKATHIIRYPKSVSCSSDFTHTQIFKLCYPLSIDTVLSPLFWICVMTGSTPARWNASIVRPIPKKSSSVPIDAFRPIALTRDVSTDL